MHGSVVRGTLARASDGFFGDGVAAMSYFAPAATKLTAVLVDDSARAGVANFGTHVSLADSHIRCASVALNGEPLVDNDFAFDDAGGNLCGCPWADGACKVLSSGLTPPDPLVQ